MPKRSFIDCPHKNVQQFTECCLDCGYNINTTREEYLNDLRQQAIQKGIDPEVRDLEKKLGTEEVFMKASSIEYRTDDTGFYRVGIFIPHGLDGILVVPTKDGDGFLVKFASDLAPQEKWKNTGDVECSRDLQEAVNKAMEAKSEILASCRPVWEQASSRNERSRWTD